MPWSPNLVVDLTVRIKVIAPEVGKQNALQNLKLLLHQIDQSNLTHVAALEVNRFDEEVSDESVDQFRVLFETLECTRDVSLLLSDGGPQSFKALQDQYRGAGYERLRQKLETQVAEFLASIEMPCL